LDSSLRVFAIGRALVTDGLRIKLHAEPPG
jgi:hypothetical protein